MKPSRAHKQRIDMHIGKVIRRIRKERGMRQRELSRASGLAEGTLSLIEAGKRVPRTSTLRCLCKAMNVELPLVYLYSIDVNDIPESRRYVFSKALEFAIALADERVQPSFFRNGEDKY